MSHTPNVPRPTLKATPSFTIPAVLGLVGFTIVGLIWVQRGNVSSTAEALPFSDGPTYLDLMNESEMADAKYSASVNNVAKTAPAKTIHAYIPARVLQEVMPQYPRMAKLVRVEGPVEVDLKIDARGWPMEAKARNGNALLQAEALKAAQSWRFSPASRNGHAVPSDFRVRFEFRLSHDRDSQSG